MVNLTKTEYTSIEITQILGLTTTQQQYLRKKLNLKWQKGGGYYNNFTKIGVAKPVYSIDAVKAMIPYAEKKNCIPKQSQPAPAPVTQRTIVSKFPDFNDKPYPGKPTEFYTMADISNMGFRPTIETVKQVYAVCRDKNIAYIHSNQPAYPDYVWGSLMGIHF